MKPRRGEYKFANVSAAAGLCLSYTYTYIRLGTRVSVYHCVHISSLARGSGLRLWFVFCFRYCPRPREVTYVFFLRETKKEDRFVCDMCMNWNIGFVWGAMLLINVWSWIIYIWKLLLCIEYDSSEASELRIPISLQYAGNSWRCKIWWNFWSIESPGYIMRLRVFEDPKIEYSKFGSKINYA